MATPASACASLHLRKPLQSPLQFPLPIVAITSGSWRTGSATAVVGVKKKYCGETTRRRRRRRRDVSVLSMSDDRVDLDDNAEGIISGEWPENFSLLSYEDLRAYLEPKILKDKLCPSSLLGKVMSTEIRAVTVDLTLEEIDHYFEFVSGVPVVDDELRCIGIVSKKDKERALHGSKSKVGDVMSSPPITLPPAKTVMDAAILMLKKKIHRIPIVNEKRQVIGMVTGTDIFQALEVVEV